MFGITRRKGFMTWEAYSEKVDFLDELYFQQRTRYESIANINRKQTEENVWNISKTNGLLVTP